MNHIKSPHVGNHILRPPKSVLIHHANTIELGLQLASFALHNQHSDSSSHFFFFGKYCFTLFDVKCFIQYPDFYIRYPHFIHDMKESETVI